MDEASLQMPGPALVSGVPGHHLAGVPLGTRMSLTGLERHFGDAETLIWGPRSLITVS